MLRNRVGHFASYLIPFYFFAVNDSLNFSSNDNRKKKWEKEYEKEVIVKTIMYCLTQVHVVFYFYSGQDESAYFKRTNLHPLSFVCVYIPHHASRQVSLSPINCNRNDQLTLNKTELVG